MQQLLGNVWSQIANDYQLGMLNSERCLQAAYYSLLRAGIDGTDWRIFVEPEMALGKSRFPDIVVCEDDSIRAIIELKFVPQGYAHFEDDLAKLGEFAARVGDVFPIELDACTGEFSKRQFAISSNTWFVFATISRYDARAVSEDAIQAGLPSVSTMKFLHQRGRTGISGDRNGCSFDQSVIRHLEK